MTPGDMVRFHADAAYVWDTRATAVETLFKASGASAIAKKQPLQLVARNCRAGSMYAVHNIQACMGKLRSAVVRHRDQADVGQRAGACWISRFVGCLED